MKFSIFFLFIVALCLCPHSADGKQKDDAKERPRILILNSYHFGYTWSDSETVGILSALKKRYPSASPSIEYLDCKHYSTMRHFDRQKDLFIDKYGSGYFSVVIAMDNPALDFAIRYRAELFSGTPIVFCGINGYDPVMLRGQKNISGIIEEFHVFGTVQLMLSVHPDAEDIVMLHDYTTTGLGARADAERMLKQINTHVRFHFMADRSMEEIADTVRQLKKGALVLLLPYTKDKDGRVRDLTEIAEIVSTNSPVPVYGVHEVQLGSGILGGMMLGGTIHGRHAGEAAVRVLESATDGEARIRHESTFVMGFDYLQMQRFNLPMQSIPPRAVVINRPESFYTRNKELVVNATAVFLLLVSIVILLSVNIVRRRKAEAALRESAQMYKNLIEAIPDGVYKRTAAGKFIEVNPAMVTILGYPSKQELLSVHIGRDLFFSKEEYKAALREEQTRTMSVFRLRKKDGSEIWVEDNSSSRTDEAGAVLYHEGILRDITDRVNSERQLLQAQKLEGIGTLAGGIAHDFNNLLAMILGSAELLKSRIDNEPKLKKYVDRIIEASERGTSISRQLLIFSRPDQAELKPISLSHIITGLNEMLQHFLPKSISIETVMDMDQGIIMGDAGQIHQALLNLAINAGDAMMNQGKLTIRTFRVSGEFIRKRFSPDAGESYAAVSVSDTGVGMPPAALEKIYEPFYSTKAPGKGTGLGLSIVHGIVKTHQGFIDVESLPGQGTTFTIYFPSVPCETAQDVAAEDAGRSQKTGTVLLVDDEPMLRETLSEYLCEEGYTVYNASNGNEALALFTEHRDSIDAVITDLGMPEMGGEELFRHLKKIDPSVDVIVSSGYLDGVTKDCLLDMGIRAVLTKPFRIQEIRSVIRSVLEPSAQ